MIHPVPAVATTGMNHGRKEMRKHDEDRLWEHIEQGMEMITCTHCLLTKEDYEICPSELYEQGWRATIAGNVYCPSCAKKKLKK